MLLLCTMNSPETMHLRMQTQTSVEVAIILSMAGISSEKAARKAT